MQIDKLTTIYSQEDVMREKNVQSESTLDRIGRFLYENDILDFIILGKRRLSASGDDSSMYNLHVGHHNEIREKTKKMILDAALLQNYPNFTFLARGYDIDSASEAAVKMFQITSRDAA